MATPVELLDQSIQRGLTANRIDGQKNSYAKDNPTEYTAVVAYLNGGARPASVSSDMGLHLVLEEDARRALNPVPLPPTSNEPAMPLAIKDLGYGLAWADDFKDGVDTDTWRYNAWYIPETPGNFTPYTDMNLGAYYADESGNTKYNYQAKDSIVTIVNRPTERKQRDLMTRNLAFQYGYIETLMRYSDDVDAWASLWCMSDNWIRTGDCSQYKVSEIDGFEAFHNLENPVTHRSHSSTIHRNTAGNCGMADQFKPNWTSDCGHTLGWKWNRFGFLWTPQTITTFVNDTPCKSWSVWDTTNQPHRLFLGIWSHTYTKEVKAEFDWIRVYQK